MLKKASIWLYGLLMAALVLWKCVEINSSYESLGKPVEVKLTRCDFTVYDFASAENPPRAIVIFGSGDGGWAYFEEAVSRTLQAHGYEVLGIDFNRYAKTDYDLATLQTDFSRIAAQARRPFAKRPPPLIIAGYSMGAAQAIAAAGGPHAPPGLVGVLLIDPCSRGRYGLRLADQADILPRGAGTFAVDEFAGGMPNLRVVQWHAEDDPIDSRAWLRTLTAVHREYDFPGTGHAYSHDREEFLRQLMRSVDWLMEASPPERVVSSRGRR